MNIYYLNRKWRERKAQVLLPAVLLAPIFALVVYLLFETAKVSMAKIRNQFALDNAAYSQVSSVSTYLNSVAMVNGPLPYRVMQYMADDAHKIRPKDSKRSVLPDITVFDLFYKGGGVPAIGPNYDDNAGTNKPPAAESTNWGLKYFEKVGEHTDPKFSRAVWEKENPKPLEEPLPLTSKKLAEDYLFYADPNDMDNSPAMQALSFYLETYMRVGSIYRSQDYAYKELSKNEVVFREGYSFNVSSCKRSECWRQSAAQLRKYLGIQTKPMTIKDVMFYVSQYSVAHGWHNGALGVDFPVEANMKEPLFQFAYLDQASRSKLKTLGRGVLLKQSFSLPRNIFNINLEQKYKPFVRNRVKLTCPRGNNNCVWPNPLPKYNVRLEP